MGTFERAKMASIEFPIRIWVLKRIAQKNFKHQLDYYTKDNPEGDEETEEQEELYADLSCCRCFFRRQVTAANIMEATIEDYRLGFSGNADTGIVLTHQMLKNGGRIDSFKHLYESWNLAFVGHYPEVPYFYAKLLVAPVTCSAAKNY